jgi:predicted dehydrogenase
MVVKWGLIGAGDIARKRVAPALRDLRSCELVSISRARSDLAESFAKEFGAAKWYADWRELIADDEIDAVYLATPVYLHAEQTIAAAGAGKHVLCEKPMALDVEGCDRMIAACRANNVTLGVAYYRRFYPVVARIREIISSGEIGKVVTAQMNAFEFFDPPADHPRRWLLDKAKSGGGPMMDFGCHRIELLSYLLGPVKAIESIVSNRVFEREVEDTAVALLQFENGSTATVTVTHAATEPQDTLAIFGTKGSINVPVLNQGGLTLRIGEKTSEEFCQPDTNFHEPLIADFADAVLSGRKPAVTGELGRETARIIAEIYSKANK